MSKRGRKHGEEVAEAPAEAPKGEEGREEAQPKPDTSPSSSGILSNRKLWYAVILIIVVAVAAWRISTFTVPDNSSGLAGRVVSAGGEDAGAQAAAVKLVDFLISRLELQYPGIEIELVGVEDYADVPGTYEVSVEITYQGQSQEVPYYVTHDGNFMFANVVDLNEPMPVIEPSEPAGEEGGIQRNLPENPAIQTFYDSGLDVCYEDGKPVIRMYASSGCGYCQWNKPIYIKVAKEYMDAGKIVAYLWEDGKNVLSDGQEAMPAEEEALRQQFGFSGVPAFIFGCKYYRSGASFSRVENGTILEEVELRNVIQDLLAA
jgi:thiol-disulfide isomerase/thioredoxin